jgi:dolichol kinase
MKRRAPELTLEADDHSRRRVFFVFGFVFFALSFSPPAAAAACVGVAIGQLNVLPVKR